MSINNKLITFAQQELVLARNDSERESIKSSLTHLENVIRNKLGPNILRFIRFGSFTRNTILPRQFDQESDVDLMVVFNTSNNRFAPGTYRKWLLDVLQVAYPNSISKKDFPAVKLTFNHIMFDVVPAYVEEYVFISPAYYIPGSGDTWRPTEPNDINEKLSQQNQHYGNNTVRNVIRLMKHWNASRNYPFESYLMEKEIIGLNFSGDNTYDGFLYTLKNLADDKSNTDQALTQIEVYRSRGDYFNELAWVTRLLPGLK